MITAVTYNCTPDSLADVSPEEFVDAFENEVRARPRWRDLAVEVTFDPAPVSGVIVFYSDDWKADFSHYEEFRQEFRRFAERAFRHCLRGA